MIDDLSDLEYNSVIDKAISVCGGTCYITHLESLPVDLSKAESGRKPHLLVEFKSSIKPSDKINGYILDYIPKFYKVYINKTVFDKLAEDLTVQKNLVLDLDLLL